MKEMIRQWLKKLLDWISEKPGQVPRKNYLVENNFKTKADTILYSGSLDECLKRYREKTEEFEKQGIFMITDVSLNGKGFWREFASKKNGIERELCIVQGFVKGKVKKEEDGN